jgi:hypothetical protein
MKDSRFFYANGTPFDKIDLIDKWIKEGIVHLKGKRPVVAIIDGGQSTGKTTLGIHLLDRNNLYCGKPPVNLAENDNIQYGLGGEQFIRKLPECCLKGFMSFEYDESGDYSRKGSLSRFNRTMDRAMDIVRIYQSLIIIVAHDFTKIPRELLDKKIGVFLFHCKERNPRSDYVNVKAYDYSRMCWIQYYRKTEVVPETAYNKVFPNFDFRFKDLTPSKALLLDRLSTHNKKELWNKTDINIQGLLTYKDLAMKVGRSADWVRHKINIANVSPAIVNHKAKYFSPNVVEYLKHK